MRAILTYHSIDDSGSPISLSRRAFDMHLKWLTSGRVRTMPLTELLSPSTCDGNAVALTFDDGFANFVTEAWPRLRDNGLPATLFVVSGHVGRTNAWRGQDAPGIPTLPLAGWDALARCREEGLDVGAHTRTHPYLPGINPAELHDEICESRGDIERRLGLQPLAFAYPYGERSPQVVATAAKAFQFACTTVHRRLGDRDDLLQLPRLDAFYFQRPGSLDTWGSSSFRQRLATRHALRRIRALTRRRPQ